MSGQNQRCGVRGSGLWRVAAPSAVHTKLHCGGMVIVRAY